MTRPRKSVSRATEKVLLVLAIGCGSYAASDSVRAHDAQRMADTVLAEQPSPLSLTAADGPMIVKADTLLATTAPPKVMGRLTIPELKLTVPIMSDFEAGSLLRGVGHIPGTALPGGLGTIGLAGHRDTYFRPLRAIKRNMDIQIGDRTGTYHYSVDSTEIVTPDEVNVLDIGSRPQLTLITCYPFDYIGAAPKRFIVHAHLISALADKL